MISIWKPCGFHVDITRLPHGHHVISRLKSFDVNVETMWYPCGNHVVSRRCSHGNHVVSTWKPCGVHMVIMLCLHGNHMAMWKPIFGQFSSFPCYFRSRKITNLWKPVTSLIMVRFSIRKKFWKAHGLLYLFVVFPVVFCHLLLFFRG